MSDLLYSIEGNGQCLDGGAMFGHVPKALWSRWLPPDPQNRIRLACRSMLIVSEGVSCLFETGVGAFFSPELATRYGIESPGRHLLTENLRNAGFRPEDIDYVILSHLHFDHAGGLLSPFDPEQPDRRELMFPSARYVVSHEAWERARKPHIRDRASFIPELQELLERSGRLILCGEGHCPELPFQNLSFFLSHGHSPGQLHSCFRGKHRTVCFCGDLIPGLPWLHSPVTMGYDRFPEQIIEEKMSLTARAEEENWILFYAHDPLWAGSACRKDDHGKVTAVDKVASFRKTEF
ncbi:MAG: MBL fold metallo-hydrolase [Deltaproteobacteria bacterium]|nr:MBL fold metallo-hydrolase [Deltaproteobacteria bacterium]